jgi:hypothetical protein
MAKDKESNRIFIHIPKTGGTSINCDMNGTEWQTQPGFNYRHIIYQTKCSNSADIFDPKVNAKYSGCELFMMLRDPIDRLFSEYYFLRDRPEFFSLLSKKPSNFYEYCLLKNTQNGMIKFLLGKKIYSNMPVFEKHYNQVQASIDKLSIRVGIFERYSDSLTYFSNCFACDWSRTMSKKRMTISKPDTHGLNEEQVSEFKHLNRYDYLLYETAYKTLLQYEFSKDEYSFTGSKYDYVLKYTERFVLIDGMLSSKRLILNNALFFKELDSFIRLNEVSGVEYVELWNYKVIEALSVFPSVFSSSQIKGLEGCDRLDRTIFLAKIIDEFPMLFGEIRNLKLKT